MPWGAGGQEATGAGGYRKSVGSMPVRRMTS
jgi:hypothetical protein